MQSRLLALGLFSAALIHPALAQPTEPAGGPGGELPVVAMQDGANDGAMPWPGPHRSMRSGPEDPQQFGPQGMGPHGLRPLGMGPRRMGPPPEMLAARLSALETRIGIRTEQLDAWRDYTSALQAMLAQPDHGPGGANPEAPGAKAPRAFAFQERLADDLTQRAASAAKLKEAIATLRVKLTPEQLEILASADRPHGPPRGPWDNTPDDAAGPGGLPDSGRPLPPPLPRTGGQR
ncbi:hypothetical protein CN311_22660 [Mesorhizobium sanjuanii]|uniref:LTXXQ motif family protein n=1 Tax=Mesorhizobium sanjuanii TaxID=2037900 RepID=A0A2A6FA61_9HYPH|nr:hypothetical protein [Mesorhizobium sanjuanii]PDQ18837.1 hypothetical protein CN311_22660 [Mesorhizobium sanjuanii]